MPTSASSSSPFPLIYRLFFLYIEPVATAVGAFYAHFDQKAYLAMTVPSYSPTALLEPSQVQSIVLTQLANMYFAFALSEALVLRSTSSRQVWRTFLLVLLLADFGHLYSVRSTGPDIYIRFWEWNAMAAGNVGFVYVGAFLRSCFLLGIGSANSATTKKAI
ncbi:hypothetical protein ANO11243_028180 [Dothideomycetidae sp. 11243]|nr:hypothetical protein ANO11243_028180 [fungal sp. No.11243]